MNTKLLQKEFRDVAGQLTLYRHAVACAISELEGLANGLDKSGVVVVTAADLRRVADGLKFESESRGVSDE